MALPVRRCRVGPLVLVAGSRYAPPRLRELRRFEPGGRAGFSDALGPERERALALLRDRAHEPRRVLQGCEEGSVRRLPREMAARVLFL